MYRGEKLFFAHVSWTNPQRDLLICFIFLVVSVQLLSRVWLFATPWTATRQASLSTTNSWSLLKLMSIQPSHPVVSFSSCLQSFLASGSFPVSQFFTSCGQSIVASASASVLPMNIQDWFPLGLTGWISLQSKGQSRVFSNTTVQKHQFSVLSFLYSPTLTSIHEYWKKYSLIVYLYTVIGRNYFHNLYWRYYLW